MNEPNNNKKVLVSVVIPVFNGADTLAACLQGIRSQVVDADIEILVIDSGSRDNSVPIAQQFGATVYSIPNNEFNHGSTRNLGANKARGEYVLMTVQDARPCDEYWIATLLQHFADPNVAGVCGQQVVEHLKTNNPVEWFRPYSKPHPRKVSFAAAQDFTALSPSEKRQYCGWDDVTAMYRRSVLLSIPFQPLAFAEDAQWAYDALVAGYTIVYDYNARVWHYHAYNFSSSARRMWLECVYLHRIFGYKTPIPRFFYNTAKISYFLLKNKELHIVEKAKWWLYNLRLLLANTLTVIYFRIKKFR